MTSGLFFLSDKDFEVLPSPQNLSTFQGQQQKGDLVIRIPGISVVFFYAASCASCKELFNNYKTLPGRVHGVRFGLANVGAYEQRIQMKAAQSKTPLNYVPYIAIYVNGKFYLEYRGPRNVESIAKAAYEIATKVYSGRDFAQGKVCTAEGGAQGYCVEGYDPTEAETCYTYEEAYDGGKVCDLKTGKCYTYEEAYGAGN